MLQPSVISFDCYGTLIDWEAGITSCLRALASAHGISLSDDAILAAYSQIEPAIQANLYRSYRVVLRDLVRDFSARLGFKPATGELDVLAESLPGWRPFPDTVPSLRALKKNHQLAIVSNIDNDLFAATARALKVRFDWIVTAEDVRSYKPAPAHFTELLRRTGVPRARHLHVAESLYHDIAPAKALGIPNVWIRRSHGKRASTASRSSPVEPDRAVDSLADLVALFP